MIIEINSGPYASEMEPPKGNIFTGLVAPAVIVAFLAAAHQQGWDKELFRTARESLQPPPQTTRTLAENDMR